MSLKAYLRRRVPTKIWQTLGFFKRLPAYWRIDRSEALRVRKRLKGLPLFVTDEIYVFIPESLTAYTEWRLHGIGDYDSAMEVREFLDLAKDCVRLMDIGAQTGFISALFARSRSRPFKILSLEPDPQVIPILHRAKELNDSPEGDWRIWPLAVSDTTGPVTISVSNVVYELRREDSERANTIHVPARTLTNIVRELNWVPDVVKIDVESFEYEILASALEFLSREKPALQLEVHWQILASRDRSARDFLSPLADIGYRGIRKRYRDLSDWQRESQSKPVSRLSLCVM
jgi:FkbM family methyltransferase